MHKNKSDNWDDLRYVLAVAQNGSVSGAARALGVNHATVLRHVTAFEHRYGASVFEKTPTGYLIARDQERVIQATRDVEAAVLAVRRIIEGVQAPLSGIVRVTSTDTFCHAVLPSLIKGLHETADNLSVELICSNAHLDLARLDADVTVRPAAKLPDELYGEKCCRLGFATYCTRQKPGQWLGVVGALGRSQPALWLEKTVPAEMIAGRADSFVTLRELAAVGLGRAILPCILGDADDRLQRIDAGVPDMGVDVWVASHVDLVDVPRIRAVRNYLFAAISENSEKFAGEI